MTSAENNISEPPNLKISWRRIPPDPLQGSWLLPQECLRYKKPSYGPA